MNGLLIGRFQPFHLGHLDALKFALSKVEKLWIGIGSSNKPNQKQNPFSADERKQMILSSIDESISDRIQIFYIPDIENHENELIVTQDTKSNYDQHMEFGLSILTHLSIYYERAPIEIKHKMIGSIFPEKLIFDGKKYRTAKLNSFISLITSKTGAYVDVKTTKAATTDSSSNLAPPLGLEPRTY